MKTSLMLLIVFISAGAHAHDFLKGRLQSRNKGHQIAAVCAVNEHNTCLGYQFYLLPNGNEASSNIITKKFFSSNELESLKVPGVGYNVFTDRDSTEGTITGDLWEILSERNSTFGESKVAEVADDVGYTVGYIVLTPFTVVGDVIGYGIGSPFHLIHKASRNSKINKLIRSVENDKIEKIDIGRFNSLVSELRRIGREQEEFEQ
jgi:hypothetical protein